MRTDPVAAALTALSEERNEDAIAILRAAGLSMADHPVALQIWSMALGDSENGAASLALLERAARIAPGEAQAHFNYAVNLQAVNALPAAIARYAHALRLAPEHLGALNNLSDLYRRRGRSQDGYALMQRYLAAGGSPVGLELRLAKLALDTHRLDESDAWFNAAAHASPLDPSVAFEHAMLLLMREDWARGWAGYEQRLALFGHAGLAMVDYQLPAWDGEGAARVLIHREQGLGDAMMFASCIPHMIDSGVHVHLAQAPSLLRVFSASFPKAQCWSSTTVLGGQTQPPQPFLQACGPLDAQAPICTLGALRMQAGPPTREAYLRAPVEEIAAWTARLEALAPASRGRRRIGLCFAARRPGTIAQGAVDGQRKSIAADALAPLAEAANTQWVSLHDASTAPLLADASGLEIIDLSPWITDFADTAAVIGQLDLVITVDTAVAHLAGGLGAPTWLLLRRNADWRWGVSREDCVWYPNMRVFRQTTDGDWRDVIAAVARALA